MKNVLSQMEQCSATMKHNHTFQYPWYPTGWGTNMLNLKAAWINVTCVFSSPYLKNKNYVSYLWLWQKTQLKQSKAGSKGLFCLTV